MYLLKSTAPFQDRGQGQTLKVVIYHVDHVYPDLMAQTTVYPVASPQAFIAGIQIDLLPGGFKDLSYRYPIDGTGKIETAPRTPDGRDNTRLSEFEKYLLKKYGRDIFFFRQSADRHRPSILTQPPRQSQGSP
jgi:hypothetical protein